jgi:hypothetical protein
MISVVAGQLLLHLQTDFVEWHSLCYWWCSLLPLLGHQDIVSMTQVVPHEGKVGSAVGETLWGTSYPLHPCVFQQGTFISFQNKLPVS